MGNMDFKGDSFNVQNLGNEKNKNKSIMSHKAGLCDVYHPNHTNR